MFTTQLQNLTSKDALIAGGKGASLGEMIHAGIPVPGGFVVGSDTFDYFIEKTGLNVQIQGILDQVNHKTISSVEEASENIQALILSFPMPEEIEQEIYSSFDAEKLEYVAVRSSATAEDGAEHAWAGQLDSFLNITRDNLIEKVRRCWASLFTPRAIFYRFEKNLHKDHISVAVVVQKMVQSKISGIAFSVHPVTQDRNQMIIEAGYGLGEAIVSGSITPDSYLVRKDNNEIDVTVNHQQKALYKAETGGNEWIQLGDKGKDQILTKEQILELSSIILRIENHYGFPCDIEWAYESGEFYIVQSRPITTLSSENVANKVEYKKAYTRDTTMIIQQGRYDCLENPLYAEIPNPYTPSVVYYMNDGVIEIWDNALATQWLMDSVQNLIKTDESKLIKLIDKYEEDLAEIKQYWVKGPIVDPVQFKKYVDRVFEVMKGFNCMYFPSVDERTPQHIRQRTLKLRDLDTYFDSNDKLMRASLIAMYPHLQGYESTILKDEVENPPSIEILKARKKSFIVIGEKYAKQQTLAEFLSLHPTYHFHIETPPANSSTLIGQVGNGGYAKGKVRIMKRKEQIGEAEEGDIIVSTMTTLDFVPAMEKASAIITDEGGITCHAVIVARELNKPCVIGTKFATQLLHDGDLVEVDADNGVVRIISSNTNDIVVDNKERQPTVTRNMSFFHQYLSVLGHYYNTKDFGIDSHHEQFSYTEHSTKTTVMVNAENMKEYTAAVMKAVSTKERVQQLEKKYIMLGDELLTKTHAVVKNITTGNWKTFCEAYQKYTAGLFITVVIGRSGGEKLHQLLLQKGYSENQIPEIVAKITYPTSHTPLFKSQLELLKIGSFLQKNSLSVDSSEIQNMLQGWLDSFGYIPVNFSEDPWTLNDAKEQLKELIQNDCGLQYINYLSSHEKKVQEGSKILADLHDDDIKILAYAIAMGTYLNEYRKNRFSLVSLHYREVFKKLATRNSISDRRDFFYLKPEEISQVIAGQELDFIKLKESRQYIAYMKKGDKILFLDQSQSEHIRNVIETLQGKRTNSSISNSLDNNIVKGYSANRGKITAVARVILSSKDFNKINKGEILVTTMTSVDFVPIMEKAGAFVTNEGGITSHASIVAREMNKPCVIGTQTGTAIIKDGDLVEVDADNGVVRILEKKRKRSI